MTRRLKRVISLILTITMIVSMTACSNGSSNTGLSDPNPQVAVENIETENIETETVLTEFITSEIYLEELVIAEDKIEELLLEEEMINEVLLCKTIYVPQENIEEFSEHSQTAGLFGDGVDLSAVMTKVAIGTGVIVTLVVLKKAGLPDPIASAVVAAADKSLQFGAGGAAIGSLFGGLTGAADELDSTGRTSAVIGFATATVGLILATISLVAEIPSGGSTTITAAAGIKLVIAGIAAIGATATTAYSGYNMVKTFTSTDAADIDWDSVDWEQLGVAAAQQAIENGADGYMWGSIIGAVYGGAEGYDYYQKYNTPYSTKTIRFNQTPKTDEYGHWTGERGESDYIYDKAKTIRISEDRYVTVEAGTRVTYRNCVPDFSPFQEAQVRIPHMTDSRTTNFKQANEALAEYWTSIRHNNQTWTARDVEAYRISNGLTWHEMNNMESMQLVPTEINAGFGHLGGVGEYNAMTGVEGVTEFD